MGQYLPIFALMVLAVLFATISAVASRVLAPRRETRPKVAPYESGIVPGREPPQRFGVRFYLVAMIFIVFDIEIIFLYPWAMAHTELGRVRPDRGRDLRAVGLRVVHVPALQGHPRVGSAQAVRTRRRPERGMVSAERTAATTVRRVGTDGRYSSAEQRLLEEVAPPPAPEPHHEPHDDPPASPTTSLDEPQPIDAGVH